MAKKAICLNFNHGRMGPAPVRFCPSCGEVVNDNISVKQCSKETHEKRQRERSSYCIDCGMQLIQQR